jgi:hypothetical protein
MPFNEATGLRDVSSRNRNPGAYGNVAISTAQSKYYGSSAYFDGTGDYIDVEGNADFAFGTGDFTVEGWVNTTTISANGGFYRRIYMTDRSAGNVAGNFQIILDIYNQGGLYLWSNASDLNLITTGSLANGQWNHFAACRSGTTLRGFVNGVLVGSTTYTTNITANNGRPRPRIGSYSSSGGNFNGYLQDLRIYKGIAKYTSNFTPPERIAETGVGFKTGALRYNTDSNKPELYDGNQWTELQISNVGLGTDGDTGPGARGVIGGGGVAGAFTSSIEYFNIASTGNAVFFGNLSTTRSLTATCSSSTRGVWAGGRGGATVNTIEYVTISSTGNATSFGVLNDNREYHASCSNSTRGVFAGGNVGTAPSQPATNNIQYITIASTGNSVTFGELTRTQRGGGATASPTRGIFVGGNDVTASNIIDFITISTLGNAQDFGDLTDTSVGVYACANATRAVIARGYKSPANINNINYVTIATTGNAVNFGDRTTIARYGGACSSSTRGVFSGGYAEPTATYSNVIDYVTILTQGNAVDFGDLITGRGALSACSNAHGGL